jgi:hypothetical protein
MTERPNALAYLSIALISVLGLAILPSFAQPNHRPVINFPAAGQVFTFEAGQGISANIALDATDRDGDFVDIVNTPLPPGAFYEFVEMSEGQTSASITFEDGHPFVGTYGVIFRAVDEHGAKSRPVSVKIVVVPPDYLDIQDTRLWTDNRVAMRVEVAGEVAPTIERPAYGFAALADGGKGLLAVATHAGILDSEDQDDVGDSVLHTHVVNVASNKDCTNGIELVSASFRSPGQLRVGDDFVKVRKVPSSVLGDLNGTIISFIITIEDGVTCINPVDRVMN